MTKLTLQSAKQIAKNYEMSINKKNDEGYILHVSSLSSKLFSGYQLKNFTKKEFEKICKNAFNEKIVYEIYKVPNLDLDGTEECIGSYDSLLHAMSNYQWGQWVIECSENKGYIHVHAT